MTAIAPMSDDPVRTEVETDAGVLSFQRYFVAEQCRPVARAIRYAGVTHARPSAAFAAALARPDLAAVMICPSNPYLSIDPILAVPGVRDRLAALATPRLAVSPIVAGQALKGPAAKLMAELGVEPDVVAVARHYMGLIDALVIDEADRARAGRVEQVGVKAIVAPAIMRTVADRAGLAGRCRTPRGSDETGEDAFEGRRPSESLKRRLLRGADGRAVRRSARAARCARTRRAPPIRAKCSSR